MKITSNRIETLIRAGIRTEVEKVLKEIAHGHELLRRGEDGERLPNDLTVSKVRDILNELENKKNALLKEESEISWSLAVGDIEININ